MCRVHKRTPNLSVKLCRVHKKRRCHLSQKKEGGGPDKADQPIRSRIDHGKIIALYTATPPRSISWIADDLGCSKQTVINHLKKEGLYGKE